MVKSSAIILLVVGVLILLLQWQLLPNLASNLIALILAIVMIIMGIVGLVKPKK